MKRLRPILRAAAAVAVMTIAMCSQAFAARIAFSDPSAEAGGEVTVTMKITATGDENINSSNVMLSYDPQALQFLEGTGASGDAGSIRVVGTAEAAGSTQLTFSLKFKALKAGSSSITISTQEVYNGDGQLVTVEQEGSSTVTVSAREGASADAALADLQISPGTLSPSFSPDTDSYTAVVGQEVESIAVSAPASDSGASVSVTGNEGLQMGDNEVICTVTASDGQTTRTYRIVVTRTEGETSGEAQVMSQVVLKTPERSITVLSSDEDITVPEGFVRCTVTIDERPVYGWVWDDEANPGAKAEYCIFYAVNESGDTGFYRYDLTEKTLQRYFRDPTGGVDSQPGSVGSEEYETLLHDYEIRFWIIIGLIALAVILLIAIIILGINRRQKDDFIERSDDDDGWETERKSRNSKLSREEQYLRDLEEEEEEAEHQDDLAFIRRVQSERENGGRSQTPAAGMRGTGPIPGGRKIGGPVPARGTGPVSGVRGTGPVSGTQVTGPVSGVKAAGPVSGGRGPAPVNQGPRGNGQRTPERANPEPSGNRAPGRGGQADYGAGPGAARGTRPAGGNSRQNQADGGGDDDFEVIDLK